MKRNPHAGKQLNGGLSLSILTEDELAWARGVPSRRRLRATLRLKNRSAHARPHRDRGGECLGGRRAFLRETRFQTTDERGVSGPVTRGAGFSG